MKEVYTYIYIVFIDLWNKKHSLAERKKHFKNTLKKLKKLQKAKYKF